MSLGPKLQTKQVIKIIVVVLASGRVTSTKNRDTLESESLVLLREAAESDTESRMRNVVERDA